MSPLVWTEQPDGWRADRYHIELVAPGLWVLSSRNERDAGRNRPEKIQATSGSLACLKYEAEQLAAKSVRTSRLIRRGVLLTVAILAMAISSASTAAWAPLVALVGTCLLLVSFLGLIDAAVGRSFDHLKATYQ